MRGGSLSMNPIVAAVKPAKVSLEANKDYFWCRCGRSKNQPFCDGSHSKVPVDKEGEEFKLER